MQTLICCTLPSSREPRAQGDQLFDVICVCIHLAAVALLRRLNAGSMYFWIKDLTQEFLKLSIIYSSVEIFDKVTTLCVPLVLAKG